MRTRLDNQLRELTDDIIRLGGQCERAIALTNNVLLTRDQSDFDEIHILAETIRQNEKAIENVCMRLLLLQQPMAQDLRTVSSALKLVTDLNRIGEISADMSDVIVAMHNDKAPDTLQQMAANTAAMVRHAIDSFVRSSEDIARNVLTHDDTVDELFNKTRQNVVEMVQKTPTEADYGVDLIMLAKYYEKIGDHAVNIAEWVIYSITGVNESRGQKA